MNVTQLRKAIKTCRRVFVRVPIALRSTFETLVSMETEHSHYAISQHVEVSRTMALKLLKGCSSDYVALAFIDEYGLLIIGGRS